MLKVRSVIYGFKLPEANSSRISSQYHAREVTAAPGDAISSILRSELIICRFANRSISLIYVVCFKKRLINSRRYFPLKVKLVPFTEKLTIAIPVEPFPINFGTFSINVRTCRRVTFESLHRRWTVAARSWASFTISILIFNRRNIHCDSCVHTHSPADTYERCLLCRICM